MNPGESLKGALSSVKQGHFASATDPEKVVDILRMIDSYRGTLLVSCALRLAPLVFVRPGELRRAEWKDINFEKAEWRYLVTGHSRYVFPCARSSSRPMSDNALLAAMRRMGISKEDMCTHGPHHFR